MCHDTKASILGAASCADLDYKHRRLQGDITEKGHPFSYNEVKPITFWQTIMEHHKVTHIVDFTPGSGALAVAASGAMEYEGIAGNDANRDWLDEGYAEQLGGDEGFVEKASKYFGGTMMEARRLMMPEEERGDDAAGDQGHDGAGDGDGPSSDDEDDNE